MGQLVIGAVGAVIGGYFGGPAGAQAGWAVGAAIGGAVFAPKTSVQGPRITDLRVNGLEYGQTIPYVRGAPTLTGQLWWASLRRPVATTTTEDGKGGPSVTATTYTYEVDLLVGFTYNPMAGLAKVLLDGKIEYNVEDAASISNSTRSAKWRRLTFYTGDFDQLPDPTYEAAKGVGLAPAYVGRSYIFFEALQLDTSGRVPNIQAKLFSKGTPAQLGYADNFADGVEPYTANLGDGLAAFRQVQTEFGIGIYGGVASQASGMEKAVGPCTGIGVEVKFSMPDGLDVDDAAAIGLDDGTTQVFGFSPRRDLVIDPTGKPLLNLQGNSHLLGSAALESGPFYQLIVAIVPGVLNGSSVTITNLLDGSVVISQAITGTYSALDVAKQTFGQEGLDATPAIFLDLVVVGVPAVIGDETLEDVAESLCLRAGLSADQFDVSELAAITKPVRGMAVSQIVSTRQIFEYLAACWFFESYTTDKQYFVPRGGAPVATLAFEDLGASEGAPDANPFDMLQGSELEQAVTSAISYMNADTDGARDAQYADRQNTEIFTTTVTEVPFVFTAEEAKAIVDAWVADQRMARFTSKISLLTQDATQFVPTDVFQIVDDEGNQFRMRAGRRRESGPTIGFDLVLDDVSVLEQLGITSADYDSPTLVVGVPITIMAVLDIPILRDADDAAGLYLAARGVTNPWPGASGFRSTDDATFDPVTTFGESAVIGNCSGTLGDFAGGNIPDEVNTVEVLIGDAALSSVTHSQMVDESANAAMIGSEILNFRVATFVSSGRYILSGLLRGRRGTEWAIGDHGASERFVLLTATGMRRVTMSVGDIGAVRYWRGITFGATINSNGSQALTFEDVGQKPFAPADARSTRLVDSATTLLLHLNGADASTSFTDSSLNAATITPAGNAQVDTAQSVFGGASLLLDGTGDYLDTPTGAIYDMGVISSSSNHTVAFRYRTTTISASVRNIASHAVPASGGNGIGGWTVYETSGKLSFIVSKNATGGNYYSTWQTTAAVFATNTWYACACVIEDGVPHIYIDGVEAAGTFLGGAGSAASFLGLDTTKTGYGIRIGASAIDNNNPSPGLFVNGWIDEFMWWKDRAVYTADYTPEVAAYDNPASSAVDVGIGWSRRTRLATNFSNGSVPLGEESEAYEVDIYDDAGYSNVLRTIEASSEFVTYTQDQQEEDFGSAQASVYAKVYQLSATVGRGYALEGVF